MAYQLYRNTTLGLTLQDTLDELVQSGKMPPQLAAKVLLQFDKSINTALNKRVDARLNFRANKLGSYRFCDNVWTLILKDVEFRDGVDSITAKKCKVVACDGKTKEHA